MGGLLSSKKAETTSSKGPKVSKVKIDQQPFSLALSKSVAFKKMENPANLCTSLLKEISKSSNRQISGLSLIFRAS